LLRQRVLPQRTAAALHRGIARRLQAHANRPASGLPCAIRIVAS
jgi:hypothetical protein